MNHTGWNVKGLAGAKWELAAIAIVLDRQLQFATDNKERLFFHFVVLKAERFSAVDVEDLADVSAGFCEDELVAPRFGDPLHIAMLKQSTVAHTVLLRSPSGKRVATLSITNSSISCAVF